MLEAVAVIEPSLSRISLNSCEGNYQLELFEGHIGIFLLDLLGESLETIFSDIFLNVLDGFIMLGDRIRFVGVINGI